NGTIVADAIKTGTLDCDLITVANLSADDIVTGTFTADRISGGILDCGLITVQNLDAGSITVGTFVSINNRLTAQAIHGDKIQVNTLNANRIVAYSIQADKIASGAVSTDKLAVGAVTAVKIDVRTITADRIQVDSLTTTEINYMSGGKLTNYSVYGNRVVNSVSLGGLVQGAHFYTPGGLAIGVAASYSGLLLQAGKNIAWTGGEGSIYDVDRIEGYNDLRLYVTGTNKCGWWSTGGGGDLSMFPYWGDFYATGTKYFRIKHPDHPDEGWLQYVSVESPEVALKIRGVAVLNNGEVTITPPHHWELATEEYLTTVQLTPLEDCNGLYAPKSSLENTSFVVKELQGGTSNAEFMWELTATRKGYSGFNPEQTLEQEAERMAESLASSPPATKEKFIEQEEKRKQEREDFRALVAQKYKLITGKEYVDKVKIWQEEDSGISEAKEEADDLLIEKARLMELSGEEVANGD
ncbi:MAG: hypothetical protein KAS32_04850, partial [Candidatus Peribacteraceae bacterium]|nr:hypothetical protein [Candidatus Peribacteraceae bacterium]